MTKDEKIYKKHKEKLYAALSSYSTHNKHKISIDEWFEIQKSKRAQGTSFSKDINNLMRRA